jgi:Icc-related predicted phosphoesterase
MKIAAVADVHSPRFLEELRAGLDEISTPDLFLMAGDMVNRGKADEIIPVLDLINEKLGSGFPIVACFGNEEYSEVRDELVDIVGSRMTFLDEKSIVLEIDSIRLGIVGTQGSLDKATNWQRRNIPSIKKIFKRRARRATSLLKDLQKETDRTMLLMHYSPCLETCEGEETKSFAWLGSRKFYKLIEKHQPDLVIHGHVHNSVRHKAFIGPTLVYNVAIPAVGKITELDLWI